MQKRALTKHKCPGLWDMPSAGHVDAGETPIEACVRETYEELGIRTEPKDFVFMKEFLVQRGWEFAQIYFLKKDVPTNQITVQKEEVECVEWLSWDEFEKLFFSKDFVNHSPEYKKWVVENLKNWGM